MRQWMNGIVLASVVGFVFFRVLRDCFTSSSAPANVSKLGRDKLRLYKKYINLKYKLYAAYTFYFL